MKTIIGLCTIVLFSFTSCRDYDENRISKSKEQLNEIELEEDSVEKDD